MAITYVNDLRLSEMGTGDNSGTWGTVTNTNLELIGEALGFGTEAITTNADTHASTMADGSTDPVRAMYVKYTGTLDSACTITIGPNTVNKFYYIENATSGSQNIIISQGSGANVTIPAGDVKAVYLDGAGSGAAVVDAFASLNVVDLKVQDDLTVTDDMTVGGTLGVTGVLTTTAGFASNAASTITTADNTAQLTLISTDADANVGPVLDLNRNVTGADDDNLGSVTFTAKDDAGNAQTFAKIDTSIRDASNSTEASRLNFHVASNGSVTKFLGFIGQTASAGAATTFNEDGNDVDFRIESDTKPNAFSLNGATGSVGFNVLDGDVTGDATAARQYVSIIGTANRGRLNLGTTASNGADAGTLAFTNGANTLVSFSTDTTSGVQNTGTLNILGTRSIKIQAAATDEVVFNESGANVDFRVESDGSPNMFLVDASVDTIGIGTTNMNVVGNNAAGINLLADGMVGISRAGTPLKINRTAEGGMIELYEAGTARGQIDINGDRLLLRSSGDTSGLRFDANGYTPFKNGSTADGTVDLGYASGRIRDVFISGGLMVGGTTSANALDDYEEGEFTVAFGGGHSGSITIDDNYKTGVYTKVGTLVTFTVHVRASAISSPGGTLDISGLPFSTPNNTDYRFTFGPCVFFAFTGMTNGDYPVAYLSNNSTTILFALTNTNSIQNFPANRITATSEFYVTGSYQVSQ